MNCIVHGVAKSQTRLSDFSLHFTSNFKVFVKKIIAILSDVPRYRVNLLIYFIRPRNHKESQVDMNQ